MLAQKDRAELAKSSRMEFLSVVVAGDHYGVRIDRITEIVRPPPITDVPRAPKHVLGVVSIRGVLATIVDLRRIFGGGAYSVTSKSRILLVEEGDEKLGLFVDEVTQVYRLDLASLEPPTVLGGEPPAYIVGVARPEGAPVIILDVTTLIGG